MEMLFQGGRSRRADDDDEEGWRGKTDGSDIDCNGKNESVLGEQVSLQKGWVRVR
jgi:hypothetical protein